MKLSKKVVVIVFCLCAGIWGGYMKLSYSNLSRYLPSKILGKVSVVKFHKDKFRRNAAEIFQLIGELKLVEKELGLAEFSDPHDLVVLQLRERLGIAGFPLLDENYRYFGSFREGRVYRAAFDESLKKGYLYTIKP